MLVVAMVGQGNVKRTLDKLSILESLYTGPCFFSENSGYSEGCVPIYPKTEYWETVDGNKKTTTHSRTMIPLRLIYAWTIWEVQGQTIKSKVVVVIGQQKESTGWHTLLCQAR